MYLFSELQIIPLFIFLLLLGAGGWLLTLRWFHLEAHERSFIGFGIGLVIANWLGNFLARMLPMAIAFWCAALLTLGWGLLSALPLGRELLPTPRNLQWGKWLLFTLAVLVFTWIGRGLGMLDDFQNLPVASLMATGDIPPHFPGSPETRFGYHYFLILLSVQFMRVASAPPWTALDLARGLTLTLAIAYAGLLAWRLTRNKTVAWISAAFFAFAGGTRWLLLLLPGSVLDRLSAGLTLIGSGRATAETLVEALARSWVVAGSGPIPFPFAFVNGVNAPAIMTHNGYGLFPGLILLLLLLLAGKQRTWKAVFPLAIFLASLALANEVDFLILYFGIILAGILWVVQNKTIRPPASAWFWVSVITLAGIFTLIQGGMATEVLYGRLFPSTQEADSYFELGFKIVPPTVISSHLGKLSLLNPIQLLTALLEMGPMILALPLVLIWGYKALREEKWFEAALVASAVPSLLSIFVQYSGNAGITATTRLLSNMFFVCRILAVPLFWLWLQNQVEWKRNLVYGLGAATMLGGILLFAIELIVIPRPVYTEYLTDMDARFYEQYWDRLSPPSAWVFDPDASRALTLFGRQTNAILHWGASKPEFITLAESPDPVRLNAAGYRYIYTDKDYWKLHTALLDQPCVNVLRTVEGAKFAHGGFVPDFRRLADISECR
jgi:hypothetical protein